LAPVYQDIHREIIELSKIGNQKAQYQLYRLYSRSMFNICYRMVNNREEAEDLLQDSFCDAFTKLDSFRFESSFGTWLKKIVVNRCINWIRKKKLSLVFPEKIDEEAQNTENEIDYEQLSFDVNKIHMAIGQLPEGYRIIFSLYALEGYDHAEISEIMGISESTSKSQYLRAKKRIKEILKSDTNEKRQAGTVYN
jgi:RNA polymerase sigma-70 factor, ECF subfamily